MSSAGSKFSTLAARASSSWAWAKEFSSFKLGVIPRNTLCNDSVQAEGKLEFPLEFLFTASSGVYYYDRGTIIRLLKGFCFGLCQAGERYYCTQSISLERSQTRYRISRILEFEIRESRAKNLRVFHSGLKTGAHQLKHYRGQLYYMDATLNAAIKTPLNQGRQWGYRNSDVINYCEPFPQPGRHLNSVWIDDHQLMFIAHNDFEKTGRNSGLYVISHDGHPLEYRELAGQGVHDIIRQGEDIYYCDSYGGVVRKNDEVVFRSPEKLWLRGLLLGGEYHVVGGCERTPRALREQTSIHLYFLDSDFNLLDTVKVGRLSDGQMGGNVKVITDF